MSFIPLCSLADIGDSGIAGAALPGGRQVAIYVVDGKAFATDDRCTHGNSSLSEEGCLDGHIVECGMHLGTFDVRTGEAVGPPCTKALRTWPVEIRDGQVMVSEAALAAELQSSAARPPEGAHAAVRSTEASQ